MTDINCVDIDCEICGTRLVNCCREDGSQFEVSYENCDPDGYRLTLTNCTQEELGLIDDKVVELSEIDSAINSIGRIQDNINCGCLDQFDTKTPLG